MNVDRHLAAAIGLVVVAVGLVVGVGVAFAYDVSSAPRRTPPAAATQPGGPAGPAVTGAAPAQPQQQAPQEQQRPDPYRPDDAWVARVAGATGIPPRALEAYARAHLRAADEQPGCRVAWNSLAALGGIESRHGSVNDAVLGDDGVPRPPILGPRLDGKAFAAIRDTDGGALDGDTEWDRAVGPLQFIPSTWARWAADGNGDGIADPHQIDDAALAAGRYLCAAGDLSTPDAWRRAIFSFNHSDAYVADIAALANRYAAEAG
ncbi:lytic murein transglycosylase [Pimelobacter sp. 30-1]|uniref:lytic transglycosylase domain-containing protein n=1 Tax=Pimelobacter sp. 30-1 TaxID=2004991 RepID=UPI001C04BC21|nr:lytic murein transglycosylase [Pimelobacter sp. 30-1]MBU2694994.1 hypothetical protein [Pimelobacter sp. 30-1]